MRKDTSEDPDLELLVQLLERHRETLFPETFTGWLMLQRCGLDASERSNVLGKTDDSLAQKDIEKALLQLDGCGPEGP